MNNLKRVNHCKFIHHKSCLKHFLSYRPCIVQREYFSIIFNVKKCTIYSIKYGDCSSILAITRYGSDKVKTTMDVIQQDFMSKGLNIVATTRNSLKIDHHLKIKVGKGMQHNAFWQYVCK